VLSQTVVATFGPTWATVILRGPVAGSGALASLAASLACILGKLVRGLGLTTERYQLAYLELSNLVLVLLDECSRIDDFGLLGIQNDPLDSSSEVKRGLRLGDMGLGRIDRANDRDLCVTRQGWL
jgi:hypothetical protein